MTPLEAKAFKVSLLYKELSKEHFPDYKFGRSSGKGDPRKTLLFKYCHKLVSETNGLLEDKEYRLYIIAQFQCLKAIVDKNNIHSLIGPNCLAGPNAWRRWRKWKEIYEKNATAKKVEGIMQERQKVDPIYIKKQLAVTKKFLIETVGSIPNEEQIKLFTKEGLIRKWLAFRKISPYYVVLSGTIKNFLRNNPKEDFGIDLDLYRNSCVDEIADYYKTIYCD